MFIWVIAFFALSAISAIFGFTGIETPSTNAAVFLFHLFSISLVVTIAWFLIHRHEEVIGHRLHRHI